MLHREHRGGGPAGGADLGVDVLDVVAGRLGRDDQPFGYLLAGPAAGEQDQDLDLAGGQPGDGLPAACHPVAGCLEHGVGGPEHPGRREIAPPGGRAGSRCRPAAHGPTAIWPSGASAADWCSIRSVR